MSKKAQPSDSIIITVSAGMIKEQGLKNIISQWARCDGEQAIWHHFLGNLPTQNVATVFWCIGGKIRWRATILDAQRNFSLSVPDGRVLKGNCIRCFDFEPMPKRSQVAMKGFRGFRYVNELDFTNE